MEGNIIENDRLILEGRKRLQMTSVTAVEGFTEQILRLVVGNTKTVITGENLKITSFNKASGNLTVEGVISEIKYGAKKQPLLKRILK